jgi:hypothetical protein
MRNVVFLKIVAVVLQQLLLCGDEFFQYLKTFDNIVEAIKDRVDLTRRDFHGSPSLKFDAYLSRLSRSCASGLLLLLSTLGQELGLLLHLTVLLRYGGVVLLSLFCYLSLDRITAEAASPGVAAPSSVLVVGARGAVFQPG